MSYQNAINNLDGGTPIRTPALQGRTAIITCAGTGVGRAVALLFADEGANVIVADHDGGGADATAAVIEAAHGRAAYFPGDLSDPQFHVALVDFAKHRYGWLDIAVNGVRIDAPAAPMARISTSTWENITARNISATFFAMRAQIPAMIKAGSGSIVNVALWEDSKKTSGDGIRQATIDGLTAITKAIASENGHQHVRANVVVPDRPDLAATNAMAAAQAILFLASSQSIFVNGTVIGLEHGMRA